MKTLKIFQKRHLILALIPLLTLTLGACGEDNKASDTKSSNVATGTASASTNQNSQPADTHTEKETTTDFDEQLNADTLALVDTFEPHDYLPDCKIPKSELGDVSCFSSGEKNIYRVTTDDKSYLINAKGEIIGDQNGYDYVDYAFGDKLLAVMQNGKVGYVNRQGEMIIPAIYDDLIDPEMKYDETWANADGKYGIVVAKDGKYGIINYKNEIVLPFDYDELDAFDASGTGLYFMYNKIGKGEDAYNELREWGIINTTGKRINLTGRYGHTIGAFAGYDGLNENLLGVYDEKSNKYGYIDKEGNEVIAPQYDEIRSFSEGLAGVLKGDMWGFIDKDNNTIIPFQYPDAGVMRASVNGMGAGMFVFYDGVAEVSTENEDEPICINKKAEIVDCGYEE